MMLKEQWIPWKPNIQLSGKYHTEVFHYDGTITLIMASLYDKTKKISVIFDCSSLSYRKINGPLMRNNLEYLQIHHDETMFSDETFFTVLNSEYMEETMEETCNIHYPEDLYHFVVIGDNSIFEMISWGEPEVTFL